MCSKPTQQEFEDEKFEDELKPGAELLRGQYTIERFLNNGGFGITYLAKDSLHRQVVIKECYPESICRRTNATVRVRSRNQVEAFRTLVELFIEEARNLARLSHPNIVGVHQVFEDNDTAYMAMDFVEGQDLYHFTEKSDNFTPAILERIVLKLLDAIAFVHRQGILHRDISPDNILIAADNNPVLIDFGAARETVTRATRYLGAMRTVKDGYSPQEFYVTTSEQYQSSDLYSLAATLYHALTRELPPNAQMRLSAIAGGDEDPYVSIKTRIEGYSEPFMDAIDQALNVFPNKRLQSAAEWRALITQSGVSQRTRGTVSQPMLAVDNGNILDQFEEAKGPSPILGLRKPAADTSSAEVETAPTPEVSEPIPSVQTRPASSGKGLFIGVAATALVALLGAGAFLTSGSDDAVVVAEADGPAPSAPVAEPVEEDVAATTADAQEAPPALPWDIPAERPAFMDAQVTPPVAARTRDLAQNKSVAPTIETGDALETGFVVVGTAVAFAVSADPADPSRVAAVSGPIAEYLSPGQRVLSVNGFPIASLDEVQRVANATAEFKVGDTVEMTLGVEDPTTGATSVRAASLPAVRQTMLLNGVSFQTSQTGEAWTTLVTTGTGQGEEDLQPGDRIVALMPGNEMIDTEDGLERVIQRGIEDGATQFNFAVNRGGDMWVATMRYGGGN